MITASGFDFRDLNQGNDWFGCIQDIEAWETLRLELENEKAGALENPRGKQDTGPTHTSNHDLA